MGQLRFALRKDIDPSSYGRCEIEEISRVTPHGSDVMVLAKRFMADPEPTRVMCLIPASTCQALRNAFKQPEGIASRRVISNAVRNNIRTYAPPCAKQGIITNDALAYLMSWIDSSLPKVPRPRSYQCLNLRRYEINFEGQVPVREWEAPHRFRVIHVMPSDDGRVASDDEVDPGPVLLDGDE